MLAVLGQTEIGPAGIDVRSDGAHLWVAAYDQVAEPRGDLVAGAALRLGGDGAVVQTVVPKRRPFVDGLAAANGAALGSAASRACYCGSRPEPTPVE